MQIVAEIGAGHNGKIENVFSLIEDTCADAFKIQTWSKNTMSIPGQRLKGGLWDGKDMTKLYQQAHLPWEWHGDIFGYGRQNKVVIFSTPFDAASVDFLEKLDCPAYKVASYEAVDLQLIRYIAQTGKPMVISTGQLKDDEVARVVEEVVKYTSNLMLLHCVSEYPTPIEDSYLYRMLQLREYGFPVGLSDHSQGYTIPVAATAMGASMIEKHVSPNQNGADGGFALRPYQFNKMVEQVSAVSAGLIPREDEMPMDLSLRRSLYFANDLKRGTRVKEFDLKTARPNKGLCPLQIEKILGRELTEDVFKNQPVEVRLVR